MNRVRTVPGAPTPTGEALVQRLRGRTSGEVRFDDLSRTIYATDASIYEITPLGVVLPRTIDDVVAVVEECRAAGVSIVPRGAGTGLTGGAVGPGVQLDLSRYLNRIGRLDVAARTIEVEPGVVLDELNHHLAPHGLQFAPDVATGSRATIGGMIANNSCGAHSIVYGRTVDHVASLTVVLADGRVVTLGELASGGANETTEKEVEARRLEEGLGRIRDENYEEIRQRFPKVLRSNGGYGLDRLGRPGTPIDVTRVICGSEGTLGIVMGATLKLVRPPRCTALAVLHFHDVLSALAATPAILQHRPAAVELIDRLIISAGLAHATISRQCDFLQGDPGALLAVEFFDEDWECLRSRVEALVRDAHGYPSCYAAAPVMETDRQAKVWNLRKAGLGLLMSRPGDAQPYAFVEDTAVDPSRLSEYMRRFGEILEQESVTAGYYAHASVGCIHVKPVLNLKRADDVERMRRIAEAVSSLAQEFGGAMTGEHGDGMVRSCWLEKMYGPRIMAAFREVKRLFDPDNLLNPHKIVDPWPMTEHLRYGANFQSRTVKTHMDFSSYGGMAGLAGMCTGVGQCRQRLVGTMCPSFMATGDETHTTRARANALRMALSNRGILNGLDDPALDEVMELCIGCKACKTECPTGVDMARLKSEFLSHRNMTRGVSRRSRLIAEFPSRLAVASKVPWLFNWLSQSSLTRGMMERRYGLDRRVPPPRLANRTFRAWFRRHSRRMGDREFPDGTVAYLVDTWTNYCSPNVGVAAVTLLESAGFRVVCPELDCCGRPAISQGLLSEAKLLAETNLRVLAPLAAKGIPIVGTEPSCLLTLVDEYPQLVRSAAARRVAEQSMMLETFLRRVWEARPESLRIRPLGGELLYHAHCHQKALIGSSDCLTLLSRVYGDGAREINSGCCGMAGSFGHEVEHYDIARAIGEQRLFPAIRERGGAAVAVAGFSCKTQIEHHTDVRPRHVVEYLAEALLSTEL